MMPGIRFRSCLLLALAFPLQAAAGDVGIDLVARAPAEAWDKFLLEGEFDGAYSGYATLDKVGYSNDGVDADACRAHAAELGDAVAKAPISVAVLRGALLCAEGTGDTEQAERLEKALLALSRDALANGRQQPWPKPIRVLGPADIYALLHMAGLESSYEYFGSLQPDRYFPLVVAAWDKETGREVHYVFDYVDPVAALKGVNEYVGYPFYRHLLVDFYLDAQARNKQLAAMDLQAMRAARDAQGTQAKVKAVRISAGYGGIQSLRLWIMLCAKASFDGCADGLAETLVGLAEKKQAVPMTMLAFIEAEGIGTRRDPALADQLLSAAMRLWTEEGVAIEYLQMAEFTDRPKAADRKVLAGAMQKTALLASRAAQRIGREEKVLRGPELQALAAPASNALGTGQSWLAEHWRQLDNEDLRVESLRLAAEAGDADAQSSYAFHLLAGDPQSIDHAQVRRWMRAAAFGGETGAMKYLSQQEIIRHDWKAAERWLMAAVRMNDSAAMLDLAQLYEQDHQEAGQTVKQAFDWYVLMAEDGFPEARRRAARLAMRGKGTPKDPVKAQRWLQQDAEAGDAESQLELALGYLEGAFGTGLQKSAQPWVDRFMASDDNSPKIAYADWLYKRSAVPADRARGVRLWEELRAAGEPWATNNMAWAFCTAPEPSARDVKRGMELSEEMLADPDLPSGRLDTVAACLAAAGEYSRAADTQQRAILKYVAYWGPDAKVYDNEGDDGYMSRLKLYQEGKPYIDKPGWAPET